jgi:IS1 family transposase
MNKLSTKKRIAVVRALVDGCSIRSVVRMTGVAKNTVVKLLCDLGTACADFHNRTVRGLTCKRIQCDEIWAFCYAKQKNVPNDLKGRFGYGDVWTWTALDAESKLVGAWHVGLHESEDAHDFMLDLAGRIVNLAQLTTDGLAMYPAAVSEALGDEVNYAQLIKLFGSEPVGASRYSPPTCIGSKVEYVIGGADPSHISTSYVERQNLTMRMGMRRFTRLTNAFSKKVENLMHGVSVHFVHYNFCRVHQTLRTTPAMAAGLADHAWSIKELLSLIETDGAN